MNKRNYILWIPKICFLIFVDQLIKQWVVCSITTTDKITLLPWLHIVLAHNTGVAFSLFANSSVWHSSVITWVTLGINICLLWMLGQQSSEKNKGSSFVLSLLLAGGVSNLIDRFVFGAVIDYIFLAYHHLHWPTVFNIADVYICVSCLYLPFISFSNSQTDEDGDNHYLNQVESE